MIPVLLGLGSNTPHAGMRPPEMLRLACARLSAVLSRPAFSSVYRTKALYVTEQADFYNMAVYGFVGDGMTPRALLAAVQKIEAEFGRDRRREIRFGPRPLDIDIEEFGGVSCSEPDLVLPHPRIQERAFVLIPALEILEKSAESVWREKYSSYLRLLPEQGVEKYSERGDSVKSK